MIAWQARGQLHLPPACVGICHLGRRCCPPCLQCPSGAPSPAPCSQPPGLGRTDPPANFLCSVVPPTLLDYFFHFLFLTPFFSISILFPCVCENTRKLASSNLRGLQVGDAWDRKRVVWFCPLCGTVTGHPGPQTGGRPAQHPAPHPHPQPVGPVSPCAPCLECTVLAFPSSLSWLSPATPLSCFLVLDCLVLGCCLSLVLLPACLSGWGPCPAPPSPLHGPHFCAVQRQR